MPDIERLTANDLTIRATDRGQVPMNIAALLEFSGVDDPPAFVAEIARRLCRIPRFRQRVRSAPFGGGRPFWVPVPGFEPQVHAHHGAPPMDLVAAEVCRRLPADRPLWRLTWCAGEPGQVAVVLVVHHVLADGMGGLAVLGALVDGVQLPASEDPPVPSRHDLVRDAGRRRLQALRHSREAVRQARRGLRELRSGGPSVKLGPTSLTRPTSSRRVIRRVGLELAAVQRAGRAFGATVNDVVVAAVGAALLDEFAARGEPLQHVVVSVPISRRTSASTTSLGNEVGAVPVLVPAGPDPVARVRSVAAAMAAAKSGERGSSAVILGWLFRGLGAVRLAQRFVDRQRLVHTFETNLRGPDHRLHIAGGRIVPAAVNPGNVCVSFDVLSYAGELGITVVMDPDAVADPERLADRLRARLAEVVRVL